MRAKAASPPRIRPPPEAKLPRIQLGPEHGITKVRTPTIKDPPARSAEMPPIQSGTRLRPKHTSTHAPPASIAGPTTLHRKPHAAKATLMDGHSRRVCTPAEAITYPKNSIKSASRTDPIARTSRAITVPSCRILHLDACLRQAASPIGSGTKLAQYPPIQTRDLERRHCMDDVGLRLSRRVAR